MSKQLMLGALGAAAGYLINPSLLLLGDEESSGEAWQAWLDQVQEEPIDTDIPVIDPHHHIWDPLTQPRGPFTFIAKLMQLVRPSLIRKLVATVLPEFVDSFGDRVVFCVKYMDEDLAREMAGHNVRLNMPSPSHVIVIPSDQTKTVYLQCLWHANFPRSELMDGLQEAEFMAGIGDKRESEGKPIVCAAVVGDADLTDENVEKLLEAYAQLPRCKGVRDSIMCHESKKVFRATEVLNKLSNPDFRRGFALLDKYGLTFETWMHHEQLEELADLAAQFPNTPIICDHVANPLGIGPFVGKYKEVVEHWKRGIDAVAATPNVYMKLSGLTMCNTVVGTKLWSRPKPPTSDDLVGLMGPLYLYCIEKLGVDRCMFASNFPVDRACCSYTVLYNAFKKIVKDFPHEDKVKLFHANAERVYNLSASSL